MRTTESTTLQPPSRRRRIALLLVLVCGIALLGGVIYPFSRAKWDHSRLEDCVIEECKWAHDPKRTSDVMRRNIWDCAKDLGLDRYLSEKDIHLVKESRKVAVDIEYVRDVVVLGYRYTWHQRVSLGGRECIASGTRIATAPGDRLVESLKLGALLVGRSTSGARSHQRLTSIRRHEAGSFLAITISGGTQLRVTPEHPIWSEAGWVRAAEIRPGSSVETLSGPSTIVSIQLVERKTTVYDLTVAGTHNFFANGILVHNKIY